MVFASRLVVTLAVMGCFAAPLCADVIPSQYAAKSEAKDQVQARLTEMGMTPDDARARAQRLTQEDATYFARNPDRVQLVGQEIFAGQSDNLWWEWALGIGAVFGTGFFIYNFASAND